MREHLRLHPERLLTRAEFLFRAMWFASAAGVFFAASLGLGMLGYHYLARLSWIDSLLNAAMILTGMGQIAPLPTTAAKIFASAYAMYSGLAFTSLSAILLFPFVQRMVQVIHAGTVPAPGRQAQPDAAGGGAPPPQDTPPLPPPGA